MQSRNPIEPGKKEVTLSLTPEWLIVGQVKFPSAEAADYAQVQLYRREVREGIGQWEPLPQVRTRADRLPCLQLSEYTIVAIENGWDLNWSSPA
jgi:hypothetical protein